MALNVKSIFYMTVGLESLLLKGTNPDMPSRVINIASMAAITTADVTSGDDGGLSAPGHGTFSYGPSKAACVHLSRIQSSKLAPKNIMVNCVCPGVFPSRMTSFGIDKCKSAAIALSLFLWHPQSSTTSCLYSSSHEHLDRAAANWPCRQAFRSRWFDPFPEQLWGCPYDR